MRYIYTSCFILWIAYRSHSKHLSMSIQLIEGISPPYQLTNLLFVHINPSLVYNVEPMIWISTNITLDTQSKEKQTWYNLSTTQQRNNKKSNIPGGKEINSLLSTIKYNPPFDSNIIIKNENDKEDVIEFHEQNVNQYSLSPFYILMMYYCMKMMNVPVQKLKLSEQKWQKYWMVW